MASLAGAAAAVIQWETVRLVELSRRPCLGIMAGNAIGGE